MNSGRGGSASEKKEKLLPSQKVNREGWLAQIDQSKAANRKTPYFLLEHLHNKTQERVIFVGYFKYDLLHRWTTQ